MSQECDRQIHCKIVHAGEKEHTVVTVSYLMVDRPASSATSSMDDVIFCMNTIIGSSVMFIDRTARHPNEEDGGRRVAVSFCSDCMSVGTAIAGLSISPLCDMKKIQTNAGQSDDYTSK